jgi:hypothetical protein
MIKNEILFLMLLGLLFNTSCKTECPETTKVFVYNSIKEPGDIDSNLIGQIIIGPDDSIDTDICKGFDLFTGHHSSSEPYHLRVIEGMPDSLLDWQASNGYDFKFTVEYYGIGDVCVFNYGGLLHDPYNIGMELVKILDIERID